MWEEVDKNISIWIQKNLYMEEVANVFYRWTDFLNSPLFKFLFLVVFLYSIFPKLKSSLKRIPLIFIGGFVFDRGVHFLKEGIARQRPNFIELGLDLGHRCLEVGGYAFPSGHSSVSFFIVGLLGTFSWKRQLLWWVLAFLVVIPRVYCGIHFLGDVLAGGVLGYLAGYLLGKFVFSAGENHE